MKIFKKTQNLIFWSVLQDRLKTKAEQVDAIMSLHTYVGHSSCFMILAPVQHHHESNEILSFSSWRNRGWCQFELATAMLLGTKPVLLISSKGAVMHLFHRNSAVGKTWRKSYNLYVHVICHFIKGMYPIPTFFKLPVPMKGQE